MQLSEQVLNWFINGEKGISSEAMAAAVTGKKPETRWGDRNHPCDPSDFNRCLKFLDSAPLAKDHMDKVAALSPVWKSLVDNWNLVEQTFIYEAGFDWGKSESAPRTYDLMKSLGC